MRFTEFRKFNDRLKATTGVHAKEQVVAEMLNACEDTAERILAAMLLVGRLTHTVEDLTTGIKEAFIAKDLGLEGRQSLEDIAAVAIQRAETGEANPTLQNVWDHLRNYLEAPERTNAAKSALVSSLMFGFARTKEDVPLLLQIACEKVSNGVKDLTVLYGLGGRKGLAEREELARAYAFNPDLAAWVYALDNPDSPNARLIMEGQAIPGIPLKPQLCDRVDDIALVLAKHGGSTLVQRKLDGQRLHIHIWQPPAGVPQVRLFGRDLRNVTEDYPEIAVAVLPLASTVQKAILDGELVALGKDGEVAPFDLLQKRLGRKTGRDAIQVGVVLYDVLLWDGCDMGSLTYQARLDHMERELEARNLLKPDGRLRIIETELCWSADDLRQRLQDAYEQGEEGLVCKRPESLIIPGARTPDWIKLKPDYMEEAEFGDSFDLVVIGYQKGRGKRHGRIGALWVAVRSDAGLLPVCKVGTGLTDEHLSWLQHRLQPLSGIPDGIGGKGIPPPIDRWVEPEVVVEVRAAQVTRIDKWGGFSLRFPRLMRIRQDKGAGEATHISEVMLP